MLILSSYFSYQTATSDFLTSSSSSSDSPFPFFKCDATLSEILNWKFLRYTKKGKCSRIWVSLEKAMRIQNFPLSKTKNFFHDFQILLCFLHIFALIQEKKDESDEYVWCIVCLMMYISRKKIFSRFMYSTTMNGI